MSLLSDEDIKKELGKNIFIYPLKLDEIKGSSINLRASKLSWSITTKETVYYPSSNKIIVPPNDTALIETEESIFVTNKISGSYHSKVKLVSKGLGHIGTTLDPRWVGTSLIALHNHTNEPVEIEPGESIVSIMFYYLKRKSKNTSTNNPGRPGVLRQFSLKDEETNWLEEEWRKDPNKLKIKMRESDEFKNFYNSRKNYFDLLKAPFGVNFFCLLICIVAGYIFFLLKTKLGLTTKDYLIPIISVYLAASTAQITNFLNK